MNGFGKTNGELMLEAAKRAAKLRIGWWALKVVALLAVIVAVIKYLFS